VTEKNDFSRRVQAYTDQLGSSGVDVLGVLFDLTSQRLVRLAIAVTRNQHDAEDAVQSVLVRVASKPHLLREAECPWAYLLRMARNEALVIRRKKKRWISASNLTDMVTVCRVDELELEETHRAVWSALRTLPTEQAEVVVLKIWEGMTFAEIGNLLEASPSTVASRYQYAMPKLARCLSKLRGEVFCD
jgi:RNA polymerase sigma-70 factor (ECF subfamily)